MEKIMTYENLRDFAYVNDKIVKSPIKGIVISFFGLGDTSMYAEDNADGIFWAERNVLYVVPYNNPWAWMNRQAIDYTDEILDILFEKYDLPKDLPIVSTGRSMGGQSAIVYTKYAKRTPAACVVNCPVCDMVFHFTERPDLPRTLYSAFFNAEGSLEEVLSASSPLHLAEKMPKVKYHIFHCDEDKAVNIDKHSKRFIKAMEDLGHSITFDIVNGRGHCDLTEEMWVKYREYCLKAIEG